MSEHKHEYIKVSTTAEGETNRCKECGAMEGEEERLRRIIAETIIVDFKANGPMRMTLLGL